MAKVNSTREGPLIEYSKSKLNDDPFRKYARSMNKALPKMHSNVKLQITWLQNSFPIHEFGPFQKNVQVVITISLIWNQT